MQPAEVIRCLVQSEQVYCLVQALLYRQSLREHFRLVSP